MPIFGRLEEFKKGQSWEEYVEIMTNFLAANGIANADKKRQVLLSCVGSETYHLIKTLVSPDSPGDKSYDELTALVKNHLDPAPSKIVTRFKFGSLSRKEGESIASFVVQLRQLALNCGFTDLEERLRDRFVIGINNEKIQTKLLSMDDSLTFKTALETALAMESAEVNSKAIRASTVTTPAAEVQEVHSVAAASSAVPKGKCFSCGGDHFRQSCKFKDATCHSCKKKGHISSVCRSNSKHQSGATSKHYKGKAKYKSKSKSTHLVEPDEEDEDSSECYSLFTATRKDSKPIAVHINVASKELVMEVDTGAALSLISSTVYQDKFKDIPLQKDNTKLITYTREKISTLGKIIVPVEYNSQKENLPLLVVEAPGPSLIGRNWLKHIRLDWPNLCKVQSMTPIEDIQEKFKEVFQESLGEYKGPAVSLYVEKDARPRYFQARRVPYAIKKKVEEAIEKNVQSGIWIPVRSSDWAAPIVPVQKVDGSIRLCGDYKLTVNQVCKVDSYPLPRIEDIYAELSGGQAFTKIDLSQAYSQIPIDDESQKFLTVNTHMGLYRVTRLPFGVSAAVGIFQRIMSGILRGLKGVAVYLDDILITGPNEQVHLENVGRVLNRLEMLVCKSKRQNANFFSPL